MKKILLLFLLILLTGCQADYNLELTNNEIKEKINIEVPNSLNQETKKQIEKDLQNLTVDIDNFDNSNDFKYNYSFEDTSESRKYNLTYLFNKEITYKESLLVNSCFENFEFKETDRDRKSVV